MAPIEFILVMVELLLCVAVILVMLLLILLLHEFFKTQQPRPDTTKGKGEQGSGEVQAVHPEREE